MQPFSVKKAHNYRDIANADTHPFQIRENGSFSRTPELLPPDAPGWEKDGKKKVCFAAHPYFQTFPMIFFKRRFTRLAKVRSSVSTARAR